MTIHVLDAHTLIWAFEANERLGTRARKVLSDPAAALCLPIIALAEACWIVGRGRTGIPSVVQLLEGVDKDRRIVVVPLDRRTLEISLSLPSVGEMHDRLIVATTLMLSHTHGPCILLTKDQDITQAGVVSTVW